MTFVGIRYNKTLSLIFIAFSSFFFNFKQLNN